MLSLEIGDILALGNTHLPPPHPFELVISLYSFSSNGSFQITKHLRKPRDAVYVFFPVLLFIFTPLYISFVLPEL